MIDVRLLRRGDVDGVDNVSANGKVRADSHGGRHIEHRGVNARFDEVVVDREGHVAGVAERDAALVSRQRLDQILMHARLVTRELAARFLVLFGEVL